MCKLFHAQNLSGRKWKDKEFLIYFTSTEGHYSIYKYARATGKYKLVGRASELLKAKKVYVSYSYLGGIHLSNYAVNISNTGVQTIFTFNLNKASTVCPNNVGIYWDLPNAVFIQKGGNRGLEPVSSFSIVFTGDIITNTSFTTFSDPLGAFTTDCGSIDIPQLMDTLISVYNHNRGPGHTEIGKVSTMKEAMDSVFENGLSNNPSIFSFRAGNYDTPDYSVENAVFSNDYNLIAAYYSFVNVSNTWYKRIYFVGSSNQAFVIGATPSNTAIAGAMENPVGSNDIYGIDDFMTSRSFDYYQLDETSAPVSSLSVTPSTLTFIPGGESKQIVISTGQAWSLTLPGWITASSSNGIGNTTVTLTAQPNTDSNRTGTVIVNGEQGLSASVSVSQNSGEAPYISVWPNGNTYNANAHDLYYRVTSNYPWRCVSSSVDWITCTATGTGTGREEIANVHMNANDTPGARSGVLTFALIGYPSITASTTLNQSSSSSSTTTYGLALSLSSKTLSAGGETYTLTVYGITYVNGAETNRSALSASDLTITSSGSSAISRNGLVFSAANLGTNRTVEQTATFSIVWNDNNASITFTCKQEANERTATSQSSTYYDNIPDPVVWDTSGTNLADKDGDTVHIVPLVNTETTYNYTYTSGATDTETRMDYNGRGEITANGSGLSSSGSSQSSYTVVYEPNPNNSERWGNVVLSYTPTGGTTQTWTRSVRQAAGDTPSPSPTQITIAYENQQGTTTTVTSINRFLYTNYIGWRFSGITGMLYTSTDPQVGDSIYINTALTSPAGIITAVSYS